MSTYVPTGNVRPNIEIEVGDEFDDDYTDPELLTAQDVMGTVIYPLDWTVSTIVSQIDADPEDEDSTGILVTDPPFQRRTAWNSARQSLFIESLMLGLPIPPLVLAESVSRPGQFYVLDGKQRLTALRRFLVDSDGLKLNGLELLANELNGHRFESIRSSPALKKYAQALQSQPIRTIVVRNWRTPALLHLIFSRLNRAAVPLASHELRQSLYPGKFTNYINSQSASSSGILLARRLTEPDFRLRDAETLLRYFAIRSNRNKYGGDLRQFLDRVLKGGNDHFDDIEEALVKASAELDLAIETTFHIFGEAAFFRFDGPRDKYMPRFNNAVFDAMTWHFSNANVRELVFGKEDLVRQKFEHLCRSNAAFASYLTTTTKTGTALNGRIDLWGDVLSECLGIDVLNYDPRELDIPIAPRRQR